MNNDYMSEFESEFEVSDFSSEYDGEANDEFDSEFESDFSSEVNDEHDSEYESNDEYEFEDNETDSEFESENYLQEYRSTDQEFEDRLVTALSGEFESSFEMEQEIDRVLHEMEVEYFWKSAKNLWKKHKNKIMPFAKHLIPGGTLASLAKFAGGDMRSLLKNGLIRKGLSLAANAVMPGVGGAVAGGLLNSLGGGDNEVARGNNIRAQVRQTVQTAKSAFGNLAKTIPNINPQNMPKNIRSVSNHALSTAKRKPSSIKGKKRKVIPIPPGAIVVVRRNRVTIYS